MNELVIHATIVRKDGKPIEEHRTRHIMQAFALMLERHGCEVAENTATIPPEGVDTEE